MPPQAPTSGPRSGGGKGLGGVGLGQGKGKGLLSLHLPPTPTFSGRSTPMCTTPAASPLGVRTASWKLASHTVKLNRWHGNVKEFELLWKKPNAFGGAEEFNAGIWSAPHTPRSFPPDTPGGHSAVGGSQWGSPRDSPRDSSRGHSPTRSMHRDLTRTYSGTGVRDVCFDLKSKPNELLDALRFFERKDAIGSPKEPFSWARQPPEQMRVLADYIKDVARDVRKLCLAEPRCVHVRAPCYILGDIHGNFQDLVAFQKALWPIGPALSPASFLFLGDYVDRGAHSVEVVTYLLAQKLIAPSKFKLLRGNHETRIQNAHSGYNPCFKDSCVQLFGTQVWG
jgi:hypothetical protein